MSIVTTDFDGVSRPQGTAYDIGAYEFIMSTLSTFKLITAASTNSTLIKSTPGTIYGWFISNLNVSQRYVKLYNKATAPTVGTDVPMITLAIPSDPLTNEYQFNGITFSTGIGIAVTTGVADNDTGAVLVNDLVINIFYI